MFFCFFLYKRKAEKKKMTKRNENDTRRIGMLRWRKKGHSVTVGDGVDDEKLILSNETTFLLFASYFLVVKGRQ